MFGTARKERCEMHSNLRHIMVLCRWAGFFPVEGLRDPYPWRIRFNLRSIYSVYYVGSLILPMLLFISLLCGSCFSLKDITAKDTINIVFMFNASVEIVLLYKLSRHWPKLINAALTIERDLNKMVTFVRSSSKSTVVCYTVVVLGMVEHVLSVIFNFNLVNNCLGHKEIDSKSFENFYVNHYSGFFQYLPYNIWIGALIEFVCMQTAFLWNFTDVMGMCFSIYLINYFRDLGKAMNSDGVKVWSKLRACYSRVVVILNLVNNELSTFILLSSFTNLFFICLQLFNSLHFIFNHNFLGHQLCETIPHHKEDVTLPKITYLCYYLYSFIFLVTRALTFAYLAATVQTSAYSGLITLYEVTSSEYDREVRCFQMQLRYTTIAISGIFFFVERKIILRAIATIITYELVLLQFSFQVDTEEVSHYNYNNTDITIQK